MPGWQMRDDDDNFDELICEELALELVDQQEPINPSTKDQHLLPPTVPCPPIPPWQECPSVLMRRCHR